ncbi:MAG: hypothetical protein E7331_04860 [Clostridiales bacterium]|nr:hypothetical protein [Clostridiales bacterium]
MRNRFLVMTLIIALCFTAAGSVFAETPQAGITSVPAVIEMGDNAVTYPQLSGLADENVQSIINGDIIVSGRISSHIVTLSSLSGSAWGLQVTYKDHIGDGFYSVMIFADGKQPNGRDGYSVVSLCYDLSTGEKISLEQLFRQPEEAVAAMEQMAEDTIGAEMTEYMEYTDIRPLPVDNFYLDDTGITFCYPEDQLLYLSGNTVSCHFFYDELSPWFIDGEEGLPYRMGILPVALSDEAARSAITSAVEDGALPGIPAAIGQPMTEIVETAQLLREPDTFPGGRYFLMEAPLYRSVFLISDNMQDGYEHSTLMGIQLRRGSLAGLSVGRSTREDWLRILGEPDETITFTESMAYDYQFPVGQSDLYVFGDNQIRFHSDENGVLFAIQLNK